MISLGHTSVISDNTITVTVTSYMMHGKMISYNV